MTLNDGSIKHITHIWNQFMDDSLSSSLSLFHLEVLLLKLVQFSLEVEVLLLLHDFPLFRHIVVLGKQTFCLVIDEVTKHFEREFLFDFLKPFPSNILEITV